MIPTYSQNHIIYLLHVQVQPYSYKLHVHKLRHGQGLSLFCNLLWTIYFRRNVCVSVLKPKRGAAESLGRHHPLCNQRHRGQITKEKFNRQEYKLCESETYSIPFNIISFLSSRHQSLKSEERKTQMYKMKP